MRLHCSKKTQLKKHTLKSFAKTKYTLPLNQPTQYKLNGFGVYLRLLIPLGLLVNFALHRHVLEML